ncbi:MAG: hypothetical protein Q8Q60_01855 [Candidatus Chromulinivorax sp.]|nr:hypothetical protein [Candidatus Chromulinivorax sp.]
MKNLSLCVLLAASGSLFAMNSSQEDNLIAQIKNQGTTISRDQARALINNIKNRLSEESVKNILEQDQKNEDKKTQERAQDSKKAFAGMRKGFFDKK